MQAQQFSQHDLEIIGKNVDLFIERKGIPKIYQHLPVKRMVAVGTGNYFQQHNPFGSSFKTQIYCYKWGEVTPSCEDNLRDASVSWNFMYLTRDSRKTFPQKLLEKTLPSIWKAYHSCYKSSVEDSCRSLISCCLLPQESKDPEENAQIQPSFRNCQGISYYFSIAENYLYGQKFNPFNQNVISLLQKVPEELRRRKYSREGETVIAT